MEYKYCNQNYFSGDTKIFNPDNNFKLISQFKVGDLITTFNQETNKLEDKKVVKVIANNSKIWYNLKTTNSSLLSLPECNYINENMEKVKLKDLNVGDKIWILRSAHKRSVRIKKLDTEYSLGYVLGALLVGDGNIWGSSLKLQTLKDNLAYKFSDEFINCFGLEPNKEIILKTNKANITPLHQVSINNVQICSIILELCNNNVKKDSFTVPRIIFNDFDIFKGFYDACVDSGFDNKITSLNKLFIEYFAELLKLNIGTVLNRKDNKEYFSLDILSLDKLKEEFELFKNKTPIIIYPDIKLETITGIKCEQHIKRNGEYKECYALEIEDNHTYIANNLYVTDCI